jgi:predicted dehydrogenase
MTLPRHRVALVGCGRIAHVHCGYLRQNPFADCVGASDLSPEAREAFAARWQVPTFADADELIAATAPSAVHIVTPPATHAPLAIDLLGRGLHVLVEKPMALSVAEADSMVEAARRAGKHLTVDHNRWFDPVVQQARALVESGALGSLAGVEVFQGAAIGEGDGSAMREGHWSTGLPGGALYDSAPHPVYLLYGFIGAVSDLRVIAQKDENGEVQELRAVAEGERALGALTISLKTRPFMNRIIVYGTAMTIEVNLNNMTLIARRTRKVPKLVGKVLPNFEEAAQLVRATVVNGIEFALGRQRYYPGMGAHFRTLYERLSRGEPPPVSAADGRAVLALLHQIWEQAGVTATPEARRVAYA